MEKRENWMCSVFLGASMGAPLPPRLLHALQIGESVLSKHPGPQMSANITRRHTRYAVGQIGPDP